MRLGKVMNYGFDQTGHERRERCEAIAKCPECGNRVELMADTEEWREGDDGRWHHLSYSGCAQAVCCELLIVNSFDGPQVFKLSEKGGEA